MISVIISTYNSEKYIKTCIDAVLKSRSVDFEIIRVDCGKNSLGLTVTHNMGAKLAVGEYLLFLDVDTKLDKNALFEIVKFFEKHNDVGVVQGKIETTGHFLSIFGFPYEVNDGRRVIFGARTACMAIRRDLFNKIGGFDEDYFMHGEETDLCWRVWLSGYKICYLPKVKCEHYGKSHYHGATPEESLRATSGVALAYNRLYYEGAKNQITTIIKDAPLSILIWMLPLNILAWCFVGLKSFCVYKGLFRALCDINKTLVKRHNVIRAKHVSSKVILGDIEISRLFLKGFRWFRSL